MPHFDKVPFPSSHQIPKSVRSLEAYYSTLSKHIRSYCIFGVSSPAQAHLLNFTFRGSIIKSFFFHFTKIKLPFFFLKCFFQTIPCAIPEILPWPSHKGRVSSLRITNSIQSSLDWDFVPFHFTSLHFGKNWA